MADVAEERRVLYVEVHGEENDGLQLEVGPDGLLVGRSNTCDVIFQNREVSRRHAYFYRDEHHCHVEDLGSKNGLLVNGRRVSKMVLRDGDVVDVGPSKFLIHSDDSDSGTDVAAGPFAEVAAVAPPVVAKEWTPPRHPLAVSSLVFAVLAYVHWGFGLGAVVLALLSLWETRQEAGSPGRGLAWAGLTLGLAGGLLSGWFTEGAPALQGAQVAAADRRCGQNLRDIAVALSRYQETHDGRYPARLDDLVAAKMLTPFQILCPACVMQGRSDCAYAYLPPGSPQAGGAGIIAWDNSPDNHAGGGWVLLRDGVAQWMQGPSFALLTSQLQGQGAAPPAAAGGAREP